MTSCFIVPTMDTFFLLLGGTATVTVDAALLETEVEEDSPTVVETENSAPDSNTPSKVNFEEMLKPVVVSDDHVFVSVQLPCTLKEIDASSSP